MAEEEKQEQYVVLARKYRPQNFEDLLGQDALVQTLTNAINNNRLHHAYILTGIRGVGKTTIADELSFALERRGKTVAFVTTDPQGGSVHEVCDDPDFAEECDFQVVDTAGVLVGGVNDWCRAANLILVPMLPSTRDMEPTLRTLDIVRESGTGAKAYVIVNNFYAYGTLDRQLVEYLEGEEVPIIAKIPRAVALSRAAAAGVSVADYDPKSHVVAPIELLADSVLNEEEKNNG